MSVLPAADWRTAKYSAAGRRDYSPAAYCGAAFAAGYGRTHSPLSGCYTHRHFESTATRAGLPAQFLLAA